jgi:hypothetical protein
VVGVARPLKVDSTLVPDDTSENSVVSILKIEPTAAVNVTVYFSVSSGSVGSVKSAQCPSPLLQTPSQT